MSDAKFQLEIITPERLAFSDSVDMVTAPAARGIVGILAHHAPLFSRLVEGEVKVTREGDEYFLAIGGGFMEVTQGRVSILVTRAVHAKELNEAEIKKAQAAAQDVISRKATAAELATARVMLRRSILDLKVLHKRRYRSSPMDAHSQPS